MRPQLIRESARFVLRHRLVRWQILFLGVLGGSTSWMLWLYQPYMQLCGLPVWAFGVAFTIYNLFAAAASHSAHRVDARFGRTGTIVLLATLQVLPPLLMARFIGPLSFLFVLGHQAVRGLMMPVFSARILRYTYADKRATVLSIASMSSRLVFATTAPLLGIAARHWSLPVNLSVQGTAIAVLLGLLLLAYRRIPAKYFAVKESVASRA